MSRKVDFRQIARKHHDQAKNLLANENDYNLRYACLELRMCIEALTYEMLDVHLSEVSNKIMSQWQPKRVIDEILRVSPDAEATRQIFLGPPDGSTPSSEEGWQFMGEDRRLTAKWINKSYNALGNFLHLPTISQLKDNRTHNVENMKRKIVEVMEEINLVLNSAISRVNAGHFINIPCVECGFEIRRNMATSPTDLECANCGEMYFLKKIDTDNPVAHVKYSSFNCCGCSDKITVRTVLVVNGAKFPCEKCGKVNVARATFVVDPEN